MKKNNLKVEVKSKKLIIAYDYALFVGPNVSQSVCLCINTFRLFSSFHYLFIGFFFCSIFAYSY